MHIVKNIYRAARGIVFTAIILVVVVYLVLYVFLSVPAFQNKISQRVETELSAFLGGEVRIGDLVIKPFNEVVVKELEVYDPNGERCLAVETVGAGISLWTLLKERKIEITYAELIGLDARISQAEEKGPLNIAFLIDAFKPKDPGKPPTKFDLNLRNVVIRRSAISFDRDWIPRSGVPMKTDFNHLRLWDFKADLNLPRLANDDFSVDLRRLSFNLSGGLDVEKIAFQAHITPESLSVNNIIVKLPSTELRPSDISLNFNGYKEIVNALAEGNHQIVFIDNPICPADFGWLLPDLRKYSDPITFNADIRGNLNEVELSRFHLSTTNNSLSLMIKGEAKDVRNKEKLSIAIDDVKLKADRVTISEVLSFFPQIKPKIKDIITNAGEVELSATGTALPFAGDFKGDARLLTSCGDLLISATVGALKKGHGKIKAEVTTEGLALGSLLSEGNLGHFVADISFDGTLAGKDINGEVTADIHDFSYQGSELDNITLHADKRDQDIKLEVTADNTTAKLNLNGEGYIDGASSEISLQSDIAYFNPASLGLLPAKYRGSRVGGHADIKLHGNNIDNAIGKINLSDFYFKNNDDKALLLKNLVLTAEADSIERVVSLKSDWISGEIKGDFRLKQLSGEVMAMLAKSLPCLLTAPVGAENFNSDAKFHFTVPADNTLTEFFNLPVRLLVPVTLNGAIEATSNSAEVNVSVPYLQQGKNKLVSGTDITGRLDGESGSLGLTATTTFPVKRGEVKLDLQVSGKDDNIFTDIAWAVPDDSSFKGTMSLGAVLSKNELTAHPEVDVVINPSVFDFGQARWNIDRATIAYKDNTLDIDGLKIWHDNQFIEIDGMASASPLDSLNVKLADIDLGYIFDTLNINYVSFGGTATGEIAASGALSREPIAQTDNLRVEGLSYNGAVLGDAAIKSSWHNDSKMVSINADIMGKENNPTTVDGGIWVTRDSLSFAIDADRVPVEFLQPFMSAFTSDVKGKASGKAKLFGSFSDIDLIGRIKADSVALKLDYTNVYYHGSDSVFLDPGKITVPSFILYDREGHSAILSGELTHRYFHEPRFTFRISDVSHLLCYDTNARLNPDWYGTLYGNGSAVVRGWPGLVSVSVDMSVVGKSSFTFVLNDTQAAEDYKFLTFSDRRKEEAEKLQKDSVADILSMFKKKISMQESMPSKFQMDVRASVTPSTLMTLVMDPVAGDKITARGNGNIQVDYDTESDEMQMFGKYVLEDGKYNFSLQDLILRDFNIRQGSSISFNGDPLNATLDITASYRVNTNLSDLDKSFSTDRDLARTNVPVDAMLMVEGQMQHPDITFDIELPTLTQDVERKVKSIISTDDMMSRQIIYLLALNRFYTPEYMGSTSNGGELASVASSTLSSQLSNMLGQLTDKFSVAPSFRSDKGDFSDLEVDVALSSRLLNNRLLINGNFGYRDRATSQTTFVGDFDIEYLLRRGGNLRLKAYNHFNDQNYYLRQALTTQGLGIIYRKEFDNPFSKFRRKKKETDDKDEAGEEVKKVEENGEEAK